MLTSFYGVGFYSYMVHGVWRYLKNVDEVIVRAFCLSIFNGPKTKSITKRYKTMHPKVERFLREARNKELQEREKILIELNDKYFLCWYFYYYFFFLKITYNLPTIFQHNFNSCLIIFMWK